MNSNKSSGGDLIVDYTLKSLKHFHREAYGMFTCNGLLFNHESPRRGTRMHIYRRRYINLLV